MSKSDITFEHKEQLWKQRAQDFKKVWESKPWAPGEEEKFKATLKPKKEIVAKARKVIAQETTRKKYQKIRCTKCSAFSNVIEDIDGVQIRQCKNGHRFIYNYQTEYLSQNRYNWNMKGAKVETKI
jgi:phage/plasmid-associated DNA primase